jgi:hypothetical protein
LKALLHPFFDELKDPKTLLPGGKPLPKELFVFSTEEYKLDPEAVEKLTITPNVNTTSIPTTTPTVIKK